MADITKEMTFGELIQKHPNVAGVLGAYGLHCIGCHVAVFETIEQGAKAHGLDDNAVEQMLKDLNEKA